MDSTKSTPLKKAGRIIPPTPRPRKLRDFLLAIEGPGVEIAPPEEPAIKIRKRFKMKITESGLPLTRRHYAF